MIYVPVLNSLLEAYHNMLLWGLDIVIDQKRVDLYFFFHQISITKPQMQSSWIPLDGHIWCLTF